MSDGASMVQGKRIPGRMRKSNDANATAPFRATG